MGKTRKDTVKALKKASRKAQPIPKPRVIPNKKREAKKNPPKDYYEGFENMPGYVWIPYK